MMRYDKYIQQYGLLNMIATIINAGRAHLVIYFYAVLHIYTQSCETNQI